MVQPFEFLFSIANKARLHLTINASVPQDRFFRNQKSALVATSVTDTVANILHGV